MDSIAEEMMQPVSVSKLNQGHSWFDLFFLFLLYLAALLYFWDLKGWAEMSFSGNMQNGDAQFWWSGAIHLADGILRNNPNLDPSVGRMGFAFFAGLWVALFGTSFFIFHKILVLLFISLIALLYSLLRNEAGRIAAVIAVLLVTFNPYTARWLTISTSDSLGLCLNLSALICLITSLKRGGVGWALGFAVLLSLGSLTRPMMTIFVLPAFLGLYGACTVSVWRRIGMLVGLSLAFAGPILAWAVVMRAETGYWEMGGQDAATLYSASDPEIQAWSSETFEKAQKSADQTYHTEHAQAAQLKTEMWRLTLINYRANALYHAVRLAKHMIVVAAARPIQSDLTAPRSLSFRRLLLFMIVLLMAYRLSRNWADPFRWAALVLMAAWMHPKTGLLVFWPAVGLLLLKAVKEKKQTDWFRLVVIPIIAYWFVGALALYLIGGTWGPPRWPAFGLNAYGDRLGFQFLFATDLITLLVACALSPESKAPSWLKATSGWLDKAALKPTRILNAAGIVLVAFFAGGSLLGAAIITNRVISRRHQPLERYPDISPVLAWARDRVRDAGGTKPVQFAAQYAPLAGLGGINENSPYWLFTGAAGDFIYVFPGQQRSRIWAYQQDLIRPFNMHPYSVLIDLPLQIREREWARRQGAWLIRNFKEKPLPSPYLYYRSEPAVRAYVPLTADHSGFDLRRAEWYPLVLSGPQIDAAGAMQTSGATLTWSGNSGSVKYARRLSLESTAADREVTFSIDTGRFFGLQNISFQYQYELGSNTKPHVLTMTQVHGGSAGSVQTPEVEASAATNADWTPLRSVELDQPARDASQHKYKFAGLLPGDKIWIYELNVVANEFRDDR